MFVYGSLMSGLHNHRHLASSSSLRSRALTKVISN